MTSPQEGKAKVLVTKADRKAEKEQWMLNGLEKAWRLKLS